MKTPCGDLPTGMLPTTFSVVEVDDGDPTQEALGHPELLAVGRDVHAVGPARHADGADDLACSSLVSISDTVPSTRLLRK